MGFLGVYRAIYDYAPQSEGELLISEGDLLYLLEQSSEDDWWKVKKKASAEDEDEPVGLVPSNYIEQVSRLPSLPGIHPSLAVVSNGWEFRHNPSPARVPFTSTRDRPTRSFPSPKMPYSRFSTHQTQTGFWSASTATMASSLPII